MADRQAITGSEKAAPADFAATARVPADERITVSVYLQAGDEPAAVLRRAVDPRAAMREAREAVHSRDVHDLTDFARQAGLDVVETDLARRLVKLSGPVSALEAAFGTELHQGEIAGQAVVVRSGALHLPKPLAERVSAVLGLDTRPVATPKFVLHQGATAPRGFLPVDIAKLYGIAGSAAGQCVGIIELGGGYTDADNQAAFAAMQLPVPPIIAVPVDGGANAPGDGSGADGEVALDLQVVGGIAVGAKLAVYFAPNTTQGFADAISQAVHDNVNKPSAISISWGGPENGWTGQGIAAMSAAFADAATLGVTVTAASGDSLATDGVKDGKAHVDYPASDPKVLGCGGTRVNAKGGKLTGEAVWNSNGGGTGGGVSALFAKPPYQKGISVPPHPGRKGGRGVPDVAGDADPDSGYRIVASGQTGLIGGTSAVAPLWAGIAALLNAAHGQPIGQPHAKLYGAAGVCRDVTTGDNRSGGIGYVAGPGWDPCTGLGSPDYAKLRTLFGG